MTLPRNLSLLLLMLACACGSYVATYAWQSAQTGPARNAASPKSEACVISNWLGLDAGQRAIVEPLESEYQRDRGALSKALQAARSELARRFEDSNVSNDAIEEQVERVIAASAELERRTAAFLIAVRPALNPDQQAKLLQHVATGVREGGGYRWRHGQPDGASAPRGGGPPPGRGRGNGGAHRQGP